MDNITLSGFQRSAYEIAAAHGFWPQEYFIHEENGERKVTLLAQLAKLALIASEVGEAVEAVRKPYDNNIGEELADIVIRVMDLAQAMSINLEKEIIFKMEKNSKRPIRHGKLA